MTSALLHKAIVIGEAAKRVSTAGQERWALPWPHVTGLRKVVVHGYVGVDLEILWRLGDEELPRLIAQIDAIL